MSAPVALLALALAVATGADEPPSASAFDALGPEARQDLLVLGETRPILLRLRIMIGGKAFRPALGEAPRALVPLLDRDGDGRVTVAEADAGGLARLLAPPGPNPQPRGAAEIDAQPKDGVLSVEELSGAFLAASGPLRVEADGPDRGRTDRLFDHLDRDKDGLLSRSERAAIVGSLRRLDRDADEWIDAQEVDPAASAAASATAAAPGRPARDVGVPSVVAMEPEESPVRLLRLVFRKYDTRSSRGPNRPDARLSPEEIALPEARFAALDSNGDALLNNEELRAFLQGPPDAILDVALSADASGLASARIRGGDGGDSSGLSARQLAEGVVEVDVGAIRLDLHADDGEAAAPRAFKALRARFDASDENGDGYLDEGEVTGLDGQTMPLSGLFRVLDRDGDGKVVPRDLEALVQAEAAVARGRLKLSAANEGRALFGMLDLDRNGRLGAREVIDTFARVSDCDRDGDGLVAPEEVPHHIRIILSRGDLSGLLAAAGAVPSAMADPLAARSTAGPDWFRKMDRNRDGDVSRREFLGSLAQFQKLDRDGDGLIAPGEAEDRAVRAPGG